MRISKVNDKNYIVIQGWMLTALHLKGNELLIYACIYGFSQLEGQVFSGSLQYLADWTNSTRQGVVKCLKSLIEKGYIAKADKIVNGVKFCEYRATKFNGVCNIVVQGMQQSCTEGVQQSLPNNLDIDNLENKQVYTRFVKPTLEEVQAYCLERGKGVDAQKWYDYYSANGWKVGKNPMKDWKAAVRTWERSGDNGKHRSVNFTPYPDEY
jgi:predicted transcriptional regulator